MLRKIAGVSVLIGTLVVAVNADAACNRCEPIKNVNDSAIMTGSGKEPTNEQVASAIRQAGVGLGWQVRDAGPGKLVAVLYIRTHTAEVEIPYSTKSYSIIYKSSVNLNEEGGAIHKNYNGWVTNFSQRIGAQLSVH